MQLNILHLHQLLQGTEGGDNLALVAECNSAQAGSPAFQGGRTILQNREMLINYFCVSLFLSQSTFQPVGLFFLFRAENQATPQEEIMFLFETENTSGNSVVF